MKQHHFIIRGNSTKNDYHFRKLENKWNERFFLGRIPRYNACKDPNILRLNAIKSKIRRWTKIYDNKNTHESNSSLINVPYDNYKNGDNTDYLRETIEKTFNKYKNKSRSTEKYSNYENENKKEVDGDESNKKEKKVQYVQRKKPTFKEFREKVLHKNSKISYSTFY